MYHVKNQVQTANRPHLRRCYPGVTAQVEGLGECRLSCPPGCLLSATTLDRGHCPAALIMKTGRAAARVELTRHSLWFHGTVSLLVCEVSQGTQA